MDGPDLQVPGHVGGRDRARSGRRRTPRRLQLRHHLRHQQRVRLRLSARQHEVPPGGLRAALAPLRHRRRSGLDPDRRSAHAADHFRAERRIHRQVLQDQPHHSQAGARRRDQGQGAGRKLHHRRLHGRRKAPQRGAHRRRHREGGKAAGLRQSVSAGELDHPAPRAAGAARARAVPSRQGLPGAGRPGDHRRRVHRARDARPPLERRACTRPSRPRKR